MHSRARARVVVQATFRSPPPPAHPQREGGSRDKSPYGPGVRAVRGKGPVQDQRTVGLALKKGGMGRGVQGLARPWAERAGSDQHVCVNIEPPPAPGRMHWKGGEGSLSYGTCAQGAIGT